jgi:ribosomal protein L17
MPHFRWALIRNQVTDLIKHERIQTTVAKAKEARDIALTILIKPI